MCAWLKRYLPVRPIIRLGLGLLSLIWITACEPAATQSGEGFGGTASPDSTAPLQTIQPGEPSSTGPLVKPTTAPAPTSRPEVSPSNVPLAVATPTVESPPVTGWQTYRNEQAGFAVEYPPGWSLSETAGPDQVVRVTLVSPERAVRVDINAQRAGGAAQGVEGNFPNTRCRQIVLGGRPATNCYDTVAHSTAITLATDGKTYLVSISGKPTEQVTIDRLLASFRLLP